MSSVPDFDLSGLGPEEARQYVLEFIRSLKETERQRIALEEELSLWEGRARLAEEKGRADLAVQARARADRIVPDLDSLRAEERDLRSKVSLMKESLKTLRSGFERSVDTEQLLANLELLAGERDETAERITETEAEMALDELKRKMEGDR